MSNLLEYIDWLLGLSLDAKDLNTLQISLRAFVVFILAIVIIRFGEERFMGRHTALDVLLGIVFGSVVSRAINGSAPFFPTIAACVVLVAMHWAFSAIAFHSSRFGWLFKGPTHQLVSGGQIDWEVMRRTHISENDLKESIRQHGHPADLEQIESAYLERNGSISVITRESQRKAASNRPPGNN
jgi:uncharacterized membrane protein YcaP (DUF421 family)